MNDDRDNPNLPVDPGLLFRAQLVEKAVKNLMTLEPGHRAAIACGIYIDICRLTGFDLEKTVDVVRKCWVATMDNR